MMRAYRCQRLGVVHVALFVAAVSGGGRSNLAQSAQQVDQAKPAEGAVFPKPSAGELSGISLPELRAELLRMAQADQIARASGT
ncbi:MAG: hypothetical protein PVI86_08120 [Phycisphaerae bacterium]|jgi:hypothetical protein